MQIPDSVYESLGMEKPKEVEEKPTQLYTTEAKKGAFEEASAENPVFVDVEIKGSAYNAREGRRIPYTIEGVVAVDEFKTVNVEDDYGPYTHKEQRASVMILDNDSFSTKEPDKATPFTKGSGYSCDPDDIRVKEVLETTPELMDKYKEAINEREYKISGCVYPEVDLKGLDSHQSYTEDIRVQPVRTEYNLKGLRSIDDAEKWLLENHPAEFLGSGISNNKGDFCGNCVPSAMIEGDWSSRKNQEETIRKYARDRFGMECGEFDFSKADITEPIWVKCKLYDTKYDDGKGYDVINNKVMKTNALSIDDAKRELLEKHPDYYLGCEMYTGTDRCLYKNSEPLWNQDSYESRYEVAKQEAKRLGASVGQSEVLKSKESQATINATLAKGETVADKSAETTKDFDK